MNRLLKTIIALAMLVALDAQAQCQMLRNFPTVLTGGGTQNWNLMQSADGLLYLANSHGLMIHDGYRWSVTPNANYSDVRAICIDTLHHRVYAGGSNELGYYDLSNRLAAPRYVSLMPLWPTASGDMGDVWNIHQMDDAYVFQSKRHLALYRHGSDRLQVVKTPTEVTASAVDHGRLMLACTSRM